MSYLQIFHYARNTLTVRYHSYYEAYLKFFTGVLLEKTASATIEEYIFSPEANSPSGEGLASGMLSRFYARIYHPLIYVGYGLEFGLLGMVAEGEGALVTPARAPALTAVVP